MSLKLNDRAVAQLKAGDRRTDIFDAALPAFGIRINTNGSKTWIAVVRRPGERYSSRLTLGKFPAMSTAEARTKARALMSGALPTPAARDVTFGNLIGRFLDDGCKRNGDPVRPSTARMHRLVLEQIAAPLHHKPVVELKRARIAELLHSVKQERGSASAALTRNVLGRFFGWMVSIDAIETSPVTHSQIYKAGRRSRVLNDGEIAAIWGLDSEADAFVSVLRLCLLTGARRAEIGGLRWSEIDGDIWSLPSSRAKNHRALKLPLPAAALAEIQRQPRILGQDHVFGRGAASGFTDWSRAKERLDRRLGLAQSWCVHDLRRTTRTRLHQIGTPQEVVTRILNHGRGPISETYDHHDYLSEMRAALDNWSNELARLVARHDVKVAKAA
jgi:integrase